MAYARDEKGGVAKLVWKSESRGKRVGKKKVPAEERRKRERRRERERYRSSQANGFWHGGDTSKYP